MPWFYDTSYNEHTGRHDLVFVNQQHDPLAAICWDEAADDYRLRGVADEAELLALLAQWGGTGEWTLAKLLDLARTRLPELDAARRRRT